VKTIWRLWPAWVVLLGVGAALAATTGGCAAASPRLPAFDHVVVIVLENKETGAVLGSVNAPTINAFARRSAVLTQYFAIAHPSLPNYLALVSGSTHDITSNCTKCVVSAKNLVDTIEAAGKTWKTYAEDLPKPGSDVAGAGAYVKRHNPLLYFADVRSRPERLARIVPLPQLARDLAARKLPDFSLVVPNLCHVMQDCCVSTGDAWLRRFLAPLLVLPRSVVFVVFDEGSSSVGGGGHVGALATGTAVQPHSRSSARLTHYSLLRTIEDAWGLPRLGSSASASPIVGIWAG
jgi:hypothetical protein